MTRFLSTVISHGCALVLAIAPAVLVYLLWDIELFSRLAQEGIGLPIQWESVVPWQWYSLWCVTALYFCIGCAAIYFLRRAFVRIASGELINLNSSRNIRRFAVLLFAQAIAKPVLLTLSSVLLSANHPAGQKVVSVVFGSDEIGWLLLALVFWVISTLMFEAHRIQSENEQFV